MHSQWIHPEVNTVTDVLPRHWLWLTVVSVVLRLLLKRPGVEQIVLGKMFPNPQKKS